MKIGAYPYLFTRWGKRVNEMEIVIDKRELLEII
jgi:hypothetical protein